MSKYNALTEHLSSRPAPITMTFAELDRVVGGLPASAGRHRAWWSNEVDGTHVQARGWLSANRRVGDVDLNTRRVTFV